MTLLTPHPHKGHKITRAFHIITALFGLAVLATHLHAENHANTEGCALQVRPWFNRKPGCALLDLNCYRLGISGQSHKISAFLDAADRASLGILLFKHCPTLQMPREFRLLSDLIAIKIYNAAVAQWDNDAALTGSDHSRL